MDEDNTRRTRYALAIVLLLFGLYAGVFVFRTSFVVAGVRHFCLFDDAMISMRYARNLADGYGPVWNPGGEKVEGYTNPLWTLAMAGAHLLGVAPAKVSLLVQLASAAILLVNLLVVRKIAQEISGNSTPAWLGTIVLTAFYLPLNAWALLGMEVGLATLLVSLAVWMALRCMAGHRFDAWLYVLMTLAVLVRIDLLVPCAVICGFLTIVEKENRHRHWIAGLAALGAGLAAGTAFRVIYYGDVLPNTYYLKMTGYPAWLRMIRGARVLWNFISHMNPILFLLPLVLLWLRRGMARQQRQVALLLLVFGGQLAYSVYVGGDAWEWWGGSNRYISIAMPLFFVLLCCTFDTALRFKISDLRFKISDSRLPISRCSQVPQSQIFNLKSAIIWAAMILLASVNLNALKGPKSLRQWALLDPPKLVARNEHMVRQALLLRKITRPDAKIALVWAGIMPYFADRQMIDISGKNDRHIARLPMHRTENGPGYDYFLPGHLKWDYGYSIGRLQPDVVLQVGYPPGEAEPFLRHAYQTVRIDEMKFHLRIQSSRLQGARLAESQ